MLVSGKRLGMSDDEIRHRYDPPLSPEDLEAAWSYHAQHPDEIEQALRDNDAD